MSGRIWFGKLAESDIRRNVLDIDEIEEWKTKIDKTSHEEMARILRFAPIGAYPFFDTATLEYEDLWNYFYERWNNFGGWNPTLSKKIGYTGI